MTHAHVRQLQEENERLRGALIKIAFGRTDCGRPLGGPVAQDTARSILIDLGINWSVEGRRQTVVTNSWCDTIPVERDR